MDNPDQKHLQAKVAYLESKVDHLESEMSYLDTILVRCGFPQGILTLKETVEEVLVEDGASESEKPERI